MNGTKTFARRDEIAWIAAADNYVYLHVNGGSHLVRDSLKAMEKKLDPQRFARVHRSAIVNLSSIAELKPLDHGDYEVTLRDGTRLTATRKFSPRLRALHR